MARLALEAVLQYEAFNRAIMAAVYERAQPDRPVYMDLDDDVLDEVAKLAGTEGDVRDALLEAVRGTVKTDAPGLTFGWHVGRLNKWIRTEMDETPPFLALLAVFVLTAEDMCGDTEFAAANYYGRLAKNLGCDPRDADLVRRLSKDYRDQGTAMWGALNSWLRAAGGRYGLPTAQAFDQRRYIGLPISQALVRSADRRRLPSFFTVFDLSPGQSVTVEDMESMLGQWISSSSVSKTIRRLWENPSMRDRISGVVVGELLAWDGAVPTIDARPEDIPIRMRIAVSAQSFPSFAIRVAALINAGGAPAGRYHLAPTVPEGVRAAVGEAGLNACASGFDGWLALDGEGEPIGPVALSGLLELDVNGRTARRPVKRLLVLERDDLNKIYVEIERPHLGVDSMLLVHSTLWRASASQIQAVLRPGWRQYEPDTCPGLPRGWVLVAGAQIVGLVSSNDDDLEALMPLSLTQISMDGGLRIPGRAARWHVDAPPEMVAACLLDDAFSLTISRESTPDDYVFHTELREGSTAVDLTMLSLEPGDYVAAVRGDGTQDRRVRSHSVFSLCSSTTSMIQYGASSWIGVNLSAEPIGASLLGAAELRNEPEGPRVVGPVILAPAGDVHSGGSTLPIPFAGVLHGAWPGSVELIDEQWASTAADDSFEMPECLATGSHRWVYPRSVPGASQFQRLEGRCTLHGGTRVFRPSMRSKEQQKKFEKAVRRPAAITSAHPGHDIAPAVALDAAFYLRRGKWTDLKALLLQVCDSEYRALDLARAICSYGYIDVALDEHLSKHAWATPEPAIVLTATAEAFLSGRVDRNVRSLVSDAAACQGGGLAETRDHLGLPVWRIAGVGREGVAAIAENLAMPVCIGAGELLLAHLPSIDTLRGVGEIVAGGGKGLQQFDFSSNKWKPVEAARAGGAYRLPGFARRYGVHAEDMPSGKVQLHDSSTAKYLAARDAGAAMLWYSPGDQELICRLGAPLPMTVERALVLESGEIPVPHRDGTLRYPGVSPSMARHVQRIVG